MITVEAHDQIFEDGYRRGKIAALEWVLLHVSAPRSPEREMVRQKLAMLMRREWIPEGSDTEPEPAPENPGPAL